MAVTENVQSDPRLREIAEEVRDWISDNWDPDLTVREWWGILADSGWGAPTWPEEWYGKGFSSDEARVVGEVLREHGCPGIPGGLGLMLAGPTIIAHGTEEQKRKYLRPIVAGEVAWCQLFSEPGAGSDLASLQTRAVRDGDEWVVNGQKVWTSGAQIAQMGMLLARTDVEVPKHSGIGYFLFDMDQEGVDVRPLVEMTGRAMFNEVFLADARVHNDDVLGADPRGGWAAALTTLANERVGLGGGGGYTTGTGGPKGGFWDRRAGDVVQPGQRQGGGGRGGGSRFIIDLARGSGKASDPTVRQDLIRLHTLNEITRYTQLRMKAARAQGKRPGPEANIMKLTMSKTVRLSRDLSLRLLGPGGTIKGEDAPLNGMIVEQALFSPAPSIYGGTDEVQKNIIGERVLGLPKEPGDDKNVPFKDLKVGTQRSPQS